TDANPPTKRPRAEFDSPISRSPVWYSDGSVVLQAETTQFRVHASILSAGSTVFKEKVAQAPEDATCQVESCPLVQLYEDKAQDVELVLLALYDRNFYQTPEKTFAQVAAMWRLGTNYGFDELRDDALRRVEYIFPRSLYDFQSRYYVKEKLPDIPLNSPIHHYPGLIFDAINLARATNLLSILPAALFRACSASETQETVVQSILAGSKGSDERLVQMSDVDKNLCVLATFRLLKKQWNNLYGWVHQIGRYKTCTFDCSKAPTTAMVSIGYPVCSATPFQKGYHGSEPLCMTCQAVASVVYALAQDALWAELPAIFELLSWADIDKDMARYVYIPSVCHVLLTLRSSRFRSSATKE
ncbi:hypothetical protein DFH06DRAFT_990948, partial [Mycena polygramma]